MNISRREELILLLKQQPMTPRIKKQIQGRPFRRVCRKGRCALWRQIPRDGVSIIRIGIKRALCRRTCRTFARFERVKMAKSFAPDRWDGLRDSN